MSWSTGLSRVLCKRTSSAPFSEVGETDPYIKAETRLARLCKKAGSPEM